MQIEKRGNPQGYKLKDFFKQNMAIILGLVAMCVFLAIYNPNFLKLKNITNVLRQTSFNLNLAVAMTMVIILGGIDLSVGAVMALVGVVGTSMMAFYNLPIWISVLIGILVGLVFGAFNGFFVAKTKIPPFIVTLATMNIARGAAYVYTGGKPVRSMSEAYNSIGSAYIANVIPLPVIYSLVILIIGLFILYKTKLGRHIYAVGGNQQAAAFAGINIKKVQFFAYTFSGLMAGITGIVLAARMFSGQPTAADGAELDAIAAVVLGGTSMSGGSGRLGGTVIGALIMGVLSNGLNLMGVQSHWQYIVKGIVILLAVYADVVKKRQKN